MRLEVREGEQLGHLPWLIGLLSCGVGRSEGSFPFAATVTVCGKHLANMPILSTPRALSYHPLAPKTIHKRIGLEETPLRALANG